MSDDDDHAKLTVGIAVAQALGMPLTCDGHRIDVPPDLLPPEGALEAGDASALDWEGMGRVERMEAGRRVAFVMAQAAALLGPIVGAVEVRAANSDAPVIVRGSDINPPHIRTVLTQDPAAWATTGDRLASASDATPLGSNAFLVGGSIIIERSGNTFSVRRRFADRADGIDATSESGALSLARRMLEAADE